MHIFTVFLLSITLASGFAGTKSSKAKDFETKYRKDPRLVCRAESNGMPHHFNLGVSGGREAKENEYPYATVLFKRRKDGLINEGCGSSLITDRHVLTATHCIEHDTFDDVDMSIAEYDLRNKNNTHLLRRTSGLIRKEGYDEDIAIMEFEEPVTFGHNKVIGHDVYVAYLPGPDFVVEDFANMSLFGWGNVGNDKKTTVLKTLDVVSNESRCHGSNDNITICVVAPNGNACGGDSGGGLIYQDHGKDVLVGTLHGGYGINCTENNSKIIFKRVSGHVEWIYEHTLNAKCKPNFIFSRG